MTRRRRSRAIAAEEHASLLRFITCGSVDDGKSTLIGRLLYESKLIFEDQLAALEADSASGSGTQGGATRFRAAGRRARGRARAGHHHRRRLSLLRHRAAQVHRRRYAGPRAIYPQHGDRRLDRRPRRHPDRRPQGRAHPDPAPQLHRARCSASATSCSRSTRWTSSAIDQAAFDAIVAEYRALRRELGIARRHRHSDVGAARATISSTPERAHALVSTARRCSSISRRCEVDATPRSDAAVPHAGAMGQPAAISISAASPGLIAAGSVQPGDAVAIHAVGRNARNVARIVTVDGDLDQAARRPVGDADLRRRGRCSPRRRDRGGRAIRRRWPTSSRRDRLDGRRADAAGPHYLAEDAAPRPSRRRFRSPNTRSTSTRWSIWRRKTLELNEIGVVQPRRPRSRSPSNPMPRTATLGGFILIDRFTNATVGAGMIDFALRRAANIHWQALDVNKRRARGAQGAEAVRAVVHRPVRRRQIDHRQSGREAAARDGPAHLSARRRQCPPRAQQGSGLHRCRPGREHPPRRRGRRS